MDRCDSLLAGLGGTRPIGLSVAEEAELRDFRLRFTDIDWGRLQATKTTLNELSLYEFNDGIQKVDPNERDVLAAVPRIQIDRYGECV